VENGRERVLEAIVLHSNVEQALCAAIRARAVLEFDYDGRHRIVNPYCHGFTRKGHETLRAVQVGGDAGGFGYGKLWTVAKIHALRPTGATFVPDDPNYNPDDSALIEIHCCVTPESATGATAPASRVSTRRQ
jgi:hypothetical protein